MAYEHNENTAQRNLQAAYRTHEQCKVDDKDSSAQLVFTPRQNLVNKTWQGYPMIGLEFLGNLDEIANPYHSIS